MRSYRSYPDGISNTSATAAKAGIHFDPQANGFPLSYQAMAYAWRVFAAAFDCEMLPRNAIPSTSQRNRSQ